MDNVQMLRGVAIQLDSDPTSSREVVDIVWGKSTEALLKTGNHAPFAVFFTPSRLNVLDVSSLFSGGDAGKDAVANLLHQLAQKEEVSALSLVTEAWMLMTKEIPGQPLPIPSEHPDRVEVLNVVVEMRGEGRTLIRSAPIIRRPDESVEKLGDITENLADVNSGRFSGLFAQGQA